MTVRGAISGTAVTVGVAGLLAILAILVAMPAARLAVAGPRDTARPLAGARTAAVAPAQVLLAAAGAPMTTDAGTHRHTPGLGLLGLALAAAVGARIARAARPAAPRPSLVRLAVVLAVLAVVLLQLGAGVEGTAQADAQPGLRLALTTGAACLLGALAGAVAMPRRGALAALLGCLALAGAAVWIVDGSAVSTAIAYAPNVAVEWIALAVGTPFALAPPLPVDAVDGLSPLRLGDLPWWQANALVLSTAALWIGLAAALGAPAARRGAQHAVARGALRGALLAVGLAVAQAVLGFAATDGPTGATPSDLLWRGLLVLPLLGAAGAAVVARGWSPRRTLAGSAHLR